MSFVNVRTGKLPARMAATAAVCAIAGAVSIAGSRPVTAATPGFHMPSRNIGCYAYGGYLRCDIAQKSWAGPPRPASCPGGYGDSFTMSRTGRPQWTCHTDTTVDSGPVLRYGHTWRSGPFTCTSRITGLTCRNRVGHGFFLSRQSYRKF